MSEPTDIDALKDRAREKGLSLAAVDYIHALEAELRQEREVIEKVREAHKPFEWTFGYGPVKSCGLCVELGATEAQASWPCETVRILATYDPPKAS